MPPSRAGDETYCSNPALAIQMIEDRSSLPVAERMDILLVVLVPVGVAETKLFASFEKRERDA